ncbi:hypothetical protein, partial [Xanthovirga aplysinae]|uniref:hypothetical protein n=1 Tax=Xanthovirga aplysinae TaxID=2529853 RepID=UPI0012BB862F
MFEVKRTKRYTSNSQGNSSSSSSSGPIGLTGFGTENTFPIFKGSRQLVDSGMKLNEAGEVEFAGAFRGTNFITIGSDDGTGDIPVGGSGTWGLI